MNSRERVGTTLNHQQPDRIPFDLGGTGATGIHKTAYQRLRQHLGLPPVEVEMADIIQQIAAVDEEVAERLGTDCRSLATGTAPTYGLVIRDQGDYTAFTDEWGIGWRMPKRGGFYYDMYHHPLSQAQTVEDLSDYPWLDPTDPHRYQGLRERARAFHEQGKFVILGGLGAGINDTFAWLRGFKNYYMDFLLNPELTDHIVGRLVDLKLAYWERVLAEAGDYIDLVWEGDDVAGQDRMLISPHLYRRFLKPGHSRLCTFIKQQAPVKVMLHTCGAVRPVIGDLIEAGFDALNPVQKSAAGMDLAALKREFGNEVAWWGGGVDTQRVFGTGTPAQVRQDVRESIEALAPGGGFVFATVHNTQANVPPENIMAMWETLQEYGSY